MSINIQLITNPHLKEFREERDYIIVISDLHLGAYNSISRVGNLNPRNEHIIDFIKLLQSLSEDMKKLKVLLILGDFFDLIISTSEVINNDLDFIIINQYFQEFKKNKIPVIVALGNHEIPVNNNYNEDFVSRKEEFESLFPNLNSLEFCQGVLIKKPKKKVRNRYIKMISNSSEEIIKSYSEYNCLFLHGFQFQNQRIRNYAAKKIWNPLLKEKNLVLKELINQLWNFYLFENRSMKEIELLLDQYLNKLKGKGISWYYKKKKIKRYILLYKFYKFFINNKTNRRYNNRIVKFLQKFIKTNYYLFYGHTHLCQENLQRGSCSISNPGTWLNTPTTSCILLNFN